MDPFDTLGIEPRFQLDVKALERRYRELQRTLHPDKHVQAPPAQRRASLQRAVDVNEAYRALRDELTRAEALLARYGAAPAGGEGDAADPTFLMEVMELREALAEARADGDLERVARLAEQVGERADACRQALRGHFEALAAGAQDALAPAAAAVGKMRYFKRFQDELAHVEEALLD